MADVNVGQMIARREELKATLERIPAIRHEVKLLNQLIALHDPLAEPVDPGLNNDKPRRQSSARKDEHDPVPSGVDPMVWGRSETYRLSGEGKQCDYCPLYYKPGQSMTMHQKIMHKDLVYT